MTLTIAVIVNALLVAGLVAGLAHVMHLPFRIGRRRTLATAVYLAGDGNRDELDRAA
jgi:hypothetical protein